MCPVETESSEYDLYEFGTLYRGGWLRNQRLCVAVPGNFPQRLHAKNKVHYPPDIGEC